MPLLDSNTTVFPTVMTVGSSSNTSNFGSQEHIKGASMLLFSGPHTAYATNPELGMLTKSSGSALIEQPTLGRYVPCFEDPG